MNVLQNLKGGLLIWSLILWSVFEIGCAGSTDTVVPDYAEAGNWAYFGIGEDREADLFLVCPTVDTKVE